MSTDDEKVGAILRRHHEDAAWFNGGLHDPHGYIALAHKDRGELLAKLRELRTGEKEPHTETKAEVIWGGGYGGCDEHSFLSAQARYSAALRSVVDNLNRENFNIIVYPPRPWWRRILDRIAA